MTPSPAIVAALRADRQLAATAVARPRPAPSRRTMAWAAAALVAAAAIAVPLLLMDRDPTRTAQTPAAASPSRDAAPAVVTALPGPTQVVTTAPAPTAVRAPAAAPALVTTPTRFDLLVSEAADAPHLPNELAQALAADGSVDLRVRNASTDPLAARPGTGTAHLAIARYDALQQARSARRGPQIGVIAPLYTEELYVVVRADSRLRFIHELRGLRINAGPAAGDRAVTARALYRRMFDKAMPAAPGSTLDARAALAQLARGGALDAVLLVGAQPEPAWAALAPETRRGLKLLQLDPEAPASRRALQAYLPARLRAGDEAGTATLASMAFLVVSGSPDADQAEGLGRLARSLCSQLPSLQRSGDAKWREVQPGLQLDAGWPPAPATAAAWSECGQAPRLATAQPAGNTSTASTNGSIQAPNPTSKGARP